MEKEVNWRSYFGDLQRYRAFSTGAGIPFACWMQTFHGEDKYRDPSESELRLDIFGTWTFGAKMQTCFTYNAGFSSLFKKTFNGSGDSVPAPGYQYLKQILHESRSLSPHLVKLRCTDAKWILGKGSEYPGASPPGNTIKIFPNSAASRSKTTPNSSEANPAMSPSASLNVSTTPQRTLAHGHQRVDGSQSFTAASANKPSPSTSSSPKARRFKK